MCSPMKGKKPSSPTPSARLAEDKWWIGWFLGSLPAQPSAWPLQSPARALVYSTSSLKPGRFAPATSQEFIHFVLPPLHHCRVLVPYRFSVLAEGHGSFYILWPVILDEKIREQGLLGWNDEAFCCCWVALPVPVIGHSVLSPAPPINLSCRLSETYWHGCGAEWGKMSPPYSSLLCWGNEPKLDGPF